MTDTMRLNGYALAWGQSVLLASTGTYERFEANAFDRMLARGAPRNFRVTWDSHDVEAPVLGCSRDGMAGLCPDRYGLSFWCQVDVAPSSRGPSKNVARIQSMMRRRDPVDKVSIGGLYVLASKRDRYLDADRETISVAEINHVTITARAMYGSHTAVWAAGHDLGEASWRIQQLASHWDANADVRSAWRERCALVASAEAIISRSRRDVDLSDARLAQVTSKVIAVRHIDQKIRNLTMQWTAR